MLKDSNNNIRVEWIYGDKQIKEMLTDQQYNYMVHGTTLCFLLAVTELAVTLRQCSSLIEINQDAVFIHAVR